MAESETTNEALNKAVEHIPIRAEKRRLKREILKQLNPPKYGPVVIYTESFKESVGSKGVKFEKGYMVRTNIKDLEAFEKEHAKPLEPQRVRR
jgi:hypothetical protein